MAYRNGNREQITLLPDSVDDYVGDDDPVRAYDAFIDCLDLKELGITIDTSLLGNSSYHPKSMLKILVYAYSYGWRSSRKIERALHHNLSFIWLSGGLKPAFKTIANFRKNNKEALKRYPSHIKAQYSNTFTTKRDGIRADSTIFRSFKFRVDTNLYPFDSRTKRRIA
jgi:transposase